MPPLVQVENLTKRFGAVHALDGLSFVVEPGEWVAIMGPSGSGKTTLINILGGLDLPTSGRAVVDGTDLAAQDESALASYRAEKVGFIFQQFHLVPYLSALENVMLAQYFHSMTDEPAARAALARVGLTDGFDRVPAQLSGGEQQRVAIARALINHPRLILADEPTGSLDEANERIVLDVFRDLHRQGNTIFLVTHAPSIGRLADRRIELAHGRLAPPSGDFSEDERVFDHILEQIWVCGEQGRTPDIDRLGSRDESRPTVALRRMAELQLVELSGAAIALTPLGNTRARDVIRRHRLAERLFTDSFAMKDSEADSQACKLEHIISPELDEKICTFLGHPRTCPHGYPIPPGPCCRRQA